MRFSEDENGCCTMVVLHGFGEETPNIYNQLYKTSPSAKDFPEFVKRLRQKVEAFDADADPEGYEEDYDSDNDVELVSDATYFHCRAIVTATTIDKQPIAEGFLKKFGFNQIGPIEKKKHFNTKLSMWYLTIPEFLKLLEKHEKEISNG